jgi:hypothetical protein
VDQRRRDDRAKEATGRTRERKEDSIRTQEKRRAR